MHPCPLECPRGLLSDEGQPGDASGALQGVGYASRRRRYPWWRGHPARLSAVSFPLNDATDQGARRERRAVRPRSGLDFAYPLPNQCKNPGHRPL
jgi:hypothetical protein